MKARDSGVGDQEIPAEKSDKSEKSDGGNERHEKEESGKKVLDEQKGSTKEEQGQQNGDEVLGKRRAEEKPLDDKQLKVPVNNSADNRIFEDTAEVLSALNIFVCNIVYLK